MPQRKRNNGRAERWVVYCRCSTDDQAEGDYTTLEVQEKKNREYATRSGGEVVDVYVDDGKTGTNLNRPGYRQLIAAAEAGKIDVVCVTYMSRLGRGKAFTIAEHELEKCGVRVELVEEKFSDDTGGYITQQMTILMDGMYPKMVSKWTKTKLSQMAKDGYYTGGTIPVGFRAEYISEVIESSDKKPPQRLVADEREGPIVKEAFKKYVETNNLTRVREYLKTVTERQWTSTKVKNLLINEAYIGIRTIGGVRHEGICPALVSQDLWDRVQESIEQQGGRRPRGVTDDFVYYLRGRVRCPHCDCPYTYGSVRNKVGEKVHYYVCLKATKGLSKCPVHRVNAVALHETILHYVREAAESDWIMRRIINNSGGWQAAGESQNVLQKQLIAKKKQTEKEIKNLTNVIAGGGAYKSLLSRLEQLETELDNTSRDLVAVDKEIEEASKKRATVNGVRSAWSHYMTIWDQSSESVRDTMMSALVQKIDVNEKNRITLQLSPVVDVYGLHGHSPPICESGDGVLSIKSCKGRMTGIEPATFGTTIRRSNRLSYTLHQRASNTNHKRTLLFYPAVRAVSRKTCEKSNLFFTTSGAQNRSREVWRALCRSRFLRLRERARGTRRFP